MISKNSWDASGRVDLAVAENVRAAVLAFGGDDASRFVAHLQVLTQLAVEVYVHPLPMRPIHIALHFVDVTGRSF